MGAMSQAHSYQRFFAELKRRKVFRVAAVYGAASFAILEASDILFPRFGFPEWTVTFIAVIALLGFPIALGLAWVYERTPDGMRRTEDAETGELETIASGPVAKRWPVGLAAAGGTALLLVSVWWTLGRPPSSAGDAAAVDQDDVTSTARLECVVAGSHKPAIGRSVEHDDALCWSPVELVEELDWPSVRSAVVDDQNPRL